MENAKKCMEEALDSLNNRWESRKNIQKEEQERAVKELISCLNSTVRDICTFAVLCWLTRLICRFTGVYEGHFMLCFKEEFKVE